ncbi:HAD superfamily hydrolase (TIGR01450 family) [Motilibacter rhizosphaerae]|uniref:HAD superfamily hydrolase (TIGR01450 family) n=1 Tax=Motilibacter rhizosphaerae TaxID=598652 RepID=A0A4Q7NCA0_9ACTN|nr:HAD-IIA family hydrolase [Motilibacter rhizosphaerae]RZS80237.1 HAD superfamily hydrolase (TIGR01450 family) [Motilibacter rhizosphaerae]
MLVASCAPLSAAYDVALLDLDGVVYVGPAAVPGAAEALAAAARDGMRLAFVTNNASRTPSSVAQHLGELGVPATVEQVVTSAQAAARLVAEQVPAGSPVLVVGGEGLVVALGERGLRAVGSADDGPVALVQGFAPEVGWRQLAEGALALQRGVPWIASNVDRTIPTPRGLAPGNGTLVEVLRLATGREPVVAGKPELPLHAEAVARTSAERPLVVGDRLDTDIEGAVRAGTPSLLVLTGVTGAAELLGAGPQHRPSYLGADLGALLEPHAAPALEGDRASLGGWDAHLEHGVLRVTGTGDPLDALRAACAAAWSSEGGVDRIDAPPAAQLPAAPVRG